MLRRIGWCETKTASNRKKGLEMDQAVSGRSLNTEAYVCARVSPRRICSGQSDIGTYFSPSSVSPCQYNSTVALHSHISSGAGMTNWWPKSRMRPTISFYPARGKVSRMWMISSPGCLLSKWAELSNSRSKSTCPFLCCNFIFTNFKCLAIYVISRQTVTNDHFMYV
jgi:hypothetical protein